MKIKTVGDILTIIARDGGGGSVLKKPVDRL